MGLIHLVHYTYLLGTNMTPPPAGKTAFIP